MKWLRDQMLPRSTGGSMGGDRFPVFTHAVPCPQPLLLWDFSRFCQLFCFWDASRGPLVPQTPTIGVPIAPQRRTNHEHPRLCEPLATATHHGHAGVPPQAHPGSPSAPKRAPGGDKCMQMCT